MQIEWAIYGERSGGHALLSTSGKQTFASKVTQYTDRPGTPPLGVEWGPVTTGFYYGDHYVFLRTLPDVHAGRAGMVRSYAAFVPNADLGKIDSVQRIFNLLPVGLTAVTGKLFSLEVPQGASELLVPADAADPIQQTVHQLCSTGAQLPVVWSFSTDYLPLIDLLWKRLPLTLRPNFAFSFQFAPEHQLPITPTVIATLPSLATRWPSNQVVKITSTSNSANAAEKWLAGDDGHADFATILDELGVTLTRFDELELLSSLVDMYRRAPQLDFAQTRKLTRILEKCSTCSPRSRASRALVFKRLCDLASDASPSEVLTLRNLKADVLPDLIPSLTQILGRWIASNSNLPSSLGGLIEVLETALEDPGSWWSKPLLRWFDELCKLKSVNASFALTDLVLMSDELTDYLSDRVPKSKGIEETLISALTRPLSEIQHAALLNLSERHDWMALHAGTLLLFLGSEDAILKHANFHTTSEEGFDYLGKKLGFTALVKAACRSDIKRLSDYVAIHLVAKTSELPVDFAATRPRCIQILLLAVRLSDQGGELRTLIAQVLGGDDELTEESRNLIMECVTKDISMLSEVEHLSDWFAALNLEQRELASSKLLEFLLKEWGRDRASTMAEAEGLDSILSARTIIQGLKSVATHEATTTALAAFRNLTFITDADISEWFVHLFTVTQHSPLSSNDAERISTFLTAVTLPSSAKIIRETAVEYNRWDVQPIYSAIRYKYEMTTNQTEKAEIKPPRLPKVVIATALSLEREEVMKFLPNHTYSFDLCADVARWPVNSPVFEIYVLQTGAGNLDSQAKTIDALNSIKPKMAFFVGVCGGVKDSRIGDVVYSTKVYYIEGGKEEDTFKARPESEKTNDKLVQLAHRVAENSWRPDSLNQEQPKATAAIFASGEKVLASTAPEAATYQRIKTAYNDVQVIDMETYGFLKASHSKDVKFSMGIRGVSDHLKGKSESDQKGNQPLAAANAVKFLFDLLGNTPSLLNKKQRKKFLGIF